jgi:mRNA-degrading endonuclease toxin of MazEF toxin-antitoxin module
MAVRFSLDASNISRLQFHSQVEHEQATHRPALVGSSSAYEITTPKPVFCFAV